MFRISRAVKPGKQLTQTQRKSSLFSEEPVVLGKVLRRGLPPMVISDEQFKANQIKLKRLWDAQAIEIEVPRNLALNEDDSHPPVKWISLREMKNHEKALRDELSTKETKEQVEAARKEAELELKRTQLRELLTAINGNVSIVEQLSETGLDEEIARWSKSELEEGQCMTCRKFSCTEHVTTPVETDPQDTTPAIEVTPPAVEPVTEVASVTEVVQDPPAAPPEEIKSSKKDKKGRKE